MIQLTRYRSFLSFSTLYHAHFFERICNDFQGLKFCSVILQFAVWEGMSLPCLPPGSRLPSPSSLGPFPTTEGPRSNYCWLRWRKTADRWWRMAYYRLQNSWQAGAKRKQYGEENAYYDYPDKNPPGWVLSKQNRFHPVSFSAGQRQFATNDKRNRNRLHPHNIPSSAEYPVG